MTPKQARKVIGKSIVVKTGFNEIATITIVELTRWDVITSDGGIMDRQELTLLKVNE